jgi:hypothetical protein
MSPIGVMRKKLLTLDLVASVLVAVCRLTGHQCHASKDDGPVVPRRYGVTRRRFQWQSFSKFRSDTTPTSFP